MITLIHLLNRVIIGVIFYSGLLLAETPLCPREFKVLIREKGEGYSFVSKKLENLYCQNKFEGINFKIVKGTSNEAIHYNEADEKLLRKAANVYYHLELARNYWINDIKSDFVPKLSQVIVRLEITNSFSDVRHFKNSEQEKNYNNAWSIPEGQEPSFLNNPKKWEKEIWFSPMKQLKTRDYVTSDGSNPIHESLVMVKDPLIIYSGNSLIYTGLRYLVTPNINQSLLLETAVIDLGVLAVIYGSVEVTKHMDKFFIEKYYYIDTAMIPEIIYHEFAHIAMSDYLKTVHSVPVIEGMADYFASRISNRVKMYEKMDDFSTNRFKNTENNSLYSPFLEGSWNATSDFTLSLLWRARKDFNVINAERVKKKQPIIADFDQLVFKAHFELDETSDISTGLTRALVNSCKEICQSVRAGVNTLEYAFEKKGLN